MRLLSTFIILIALTGAIFTPMLSQDWGHEFSFLDLTEIFETEEEPNEQKEESKSMDVLNAFHPKKWVVEISKFSQFFRIGFQDGFRSGIDFPPEAV